jgi:hypothetical protein
MRSTTKERKYIHINMLPYEELESAIYSSMVAENMGIYSGTAAAISVPRKDLVLPQENCGHESAFGSPQRLHIELMCGAAENRQCGISASSGVWFSPLAAGSVAPAGSLMARKCFNRRRILRLMTRRFPARALSASAGATFRPVRAP